MTEILLQELTNTDIDWIVTSGERKQIPVGSILAEPNEKPEFLHLILDGKLSVLTPGSATCAEQEIAQLLRGDILGLPALLENRPMMSVVKAAEDLVILSLPRSQLVEKLRQDVYFAAHFYRVAALLLSERIRRMFENPERLSYREGQQVKEALFVFGEMLDSDIDWLISTGTVKRLAANEVLAHAGRPVDSLHIILDGLLSISIPEGNYDPLSLCFAGLEKATRSQQTIATISKGGMPGIVSFLDSRPLPITIRSINESLIFAVPRLRLAVKLEEDPGFASRFCRVIALQECELLYDVMSRLGCGQAVHNQQQRMDKDMEYEDELDLDSLDQISQGANRFNWLLKRLGVGYAL
ncbi:MAG: hypothetical protein Kow00121_17930 [Elainellaceae cyanobacterium]